LINATSSARARSTKTAGGSTPSALSHTKIPRWKPSYINFMQDDDYDKIRDNYRQNYDRLVQVKKTYDPDNLFHINQNITP
jgi:hypothetical protein